MPIDDINTKINSGIASIEIKQLELDTWWNGLSQVQQRLNQIKYDVANELLNKANNLLVELAEGVSSLASSEVQYSLDKRLKNKWNFIVGSQYQINKHWMLRAEVGFLGSRNQVIAGLQYRFGL